MSGSLEVIGIEGMGEIRAGDDLARIIVTAIATAGVGLEAHDVVVVTQKIVSKAENRMVRIDPSDPRGHRAVVEAESRGCCAGAVTW
ncbi:MAG: coenzyme F420-0:L-glutamate ligase [Acidimicrobiales bacterium]